ncbi:MAG: hypothetical protein Q7S27_04310 [Nanoarchaeota archaeon]|nr:hypothetical protein [Nanoarchaeota archaeon]
MEQIITRAVNFPIPRIIERYKHKNKLSEEEARRHEMEMKKYLAIRAIHPTEKFPLSHGPVDELWHTFLIFTNEYAEFCRVVANGFIHHNPGPPNPTEEQIDKAQQDYNTFTKIYAEKFGENPPSNIWPDIGKSGTLWSC